MPGEEGHLISEGLAPDSGAAESDPGFVPLESEPHTFEIKPEPVSVAGSSTQIPVTVPHESPHPDQAVDTETPHATAEAGHLDRTNDVNLRIASQTGNDTAPPEEPYDLLKRREDLDNPDSKGNQPTGDSSDPRGESDLSKLEEPAVPATDADAIAADIADIESGQNASAENEKEGLDSLSHDKQAEVLEHIASLLREHEVSPAYRDANLAIGGDITTSEGLLALALKAHQAVLAAETLKFVSPGAAVAKLKEAVLSLQVLADIESGVASDPDYKLPVKSALPT